MTNKEKNIAAQNPSSPQESKLDTGAENIPPPAQEPGEQPAMEDVRHVTDNKFANLIDKLSREAEQQRLTKARQFNQRQRLYFIVMTTFLMLSSSYFIWTLLMGDYLVVGEQFVDGGISLGGNMKWAIVALLSAIFITVLLRFWSAKPEKDYIRDFKNRYMPALADSLGKMTFHPTGGISEKALAPTRILPPYDEYRAEDCFRGKYKGVNLMISEARLYHKKKKGEPVFDGVFVLLATPKKKFKGHTIITADKQAVTRYSPRRWKKLQEVTTAETVQSGEFRVFSSQPEEAVQLADHDMMELMHKLSTLFDNAPLSAVFYAGRHVFLMIPYDGDMFEPGDIFMPVTKPDHALKCKKEIEQILSAVDIVEVYEPDENLQSSPS